MYSHKYFVVVYYGTHQICQIECENENEAKKMFDSVTLCSGARKHIYMYFYSRNKTLGKDQFEKIEVLETETYKG